MVANDSELRFLPAGLGKLVVGPVKVCFLYPTIRVPVNIEVLDWDDEATAENQKNKQ